MSRSKTSSPIVVSGTITSPNWDSFVVGDPPLDAQWYRCLHEPTAEARIVSTPDTLGGTSRFDGTRLPVKLILDLLAEGQTHDQIESMYPGLPKDWRSLVAAIRPLLRSKWRQAIPR